MMNSRGLGITRCIAVCIARYKARSQTTGLGWTPRVTLAPATCPMKSERVEGVRGGSRSITVGATAASGCQWVSR